jgi:hypothetical protein
MSDSDLQITITADAGGVGQGTQQAKSAIAGLASALSGIQSSFTGFGAAAAKAFAAPNVSGLTGAIGQVRSSCAELGGSLGRAGEAMGAFNVSGVVRGVGQIRSALAGARPGVDAFTRSFDGLSNKTKEAFSGVGAALAGASGQAAQTKPVQPQNAQPAAPQGAGPSSTEAANSQILASNAAVTAAYAAGQQQQQAAAQKAETAKTAASDRSTAHVIANDRKLLEALKSSVDSMISTFNQGLLQMAERTKSLSQVMRSLGQQLLEDMLRVIDQIVERWAWGEAEKVLATAQGQALLQAMGLKDLAAQILIEAKKTQAVVSGVTAQTAAKSSANAAGAAPQVVNALQTLRADAAQVFGNVFAWMTSNPVTAPAAPAAAAAASAAVMAVPFAAGINVVPNDMLAVVHQGERIMPKADNTALMSALGALHGVTNVAPTTYRPPAPTLGAASAAGGPLGGAGASAGTTNHNTLVYSPQVTPQQDFRKDLQDHASDVFALMQRGLRDGVLKV